MLKEKDKAPNFILEDINLNKISLEDFKGKKVVLYFYPKDDTKGCTKQAILFSELKKDIESKNAVIIGISKDSIKSHKNFIEKNNLNFILLSDENLETIKSYDVWKEKSMYGKKYMGVVRSTFIIDENGYIIKIMEKVNPQNNPQDVLKYLESYEN